MNQKKKAVTLYFTDGSNLTDDDIDAMNRVPNARHRNARFVDPDSKPEPCDFVAGPAIPDAYKDVPRAPMLVVATDANDNGQSDLSEFNPNKANVAQLKAALDELGVEYDASAKKADLILLYEEHAGE